jgi:ferric-dicitrate binding protein FerR (iron transport regulator)
MFVHPGGPTEDALFDYLAGRLHPQAAEWIREHVEGCARCSALAVRVRDVRSALEPPPEEPFQRQRDITSVRRRLERPRRRLHWVALSTGVAFAALAFALWIGFQRHKTVELAQAQPQAPWSVLAREGAADVEVGDEHSVVQANAPVPSGSVIEVKPQSRVLARWGGARVVVDGGSRGARVRLEASRADERRLKLERGRVVLEVDPLAPGAQLAVVTDDEKVSVRGTRFLVERSAEGTVVAVAHGRVLVASRARTVEVASGQRLAPHAAAPTALETDDAKALDVVTPLAAIGAAPESLDVFADTPGAEVSVDGVPHGRAPVSLAVPPGVHRVRVTAPGRLPSEERVEVSPGMPALYRAELGELKTELEPEPEPPRASVTSSSHASSAPSTKTGRSGQSESSAASASSAQSHHNVEPPLGRADFSTARAEVLAGQYERAVAHLEGLRRTRLSPSDDTRAALLEAQAFRLERRPERAVPLLEHVARGEGHEAEQGLVLLAQTLGRDLADPRRAAVVWADAERRFPHGIFHEEASFRLGEALLEAGETLEGVDALERYLRAFPQATHADDAHLLIAGARRDRLGDCAGAIPHLRVVADGKASPRAELALIGEARCLKSMGRVEEARVLYVRYLAQSPRGRFSDEARTGATARSDRRR